MGRFLSQDLCCHTILSKNQLFHPYMIPHYFLSRLARQPTQIIYSSFSKVFSSKNPPQQELPHQTNNILEQLQDLQESINANNSFSRSALIWSSVSALVSIALFLRVEYMFNPRFNEAWNNYTAGDGECTFPLFSQKNQQSSSTGQQDFGGGIIVRLPSNDSENVDSNS